MRACESEEDGNKVSWGQTVPKERIIPHYETYCPLLRGVIDAPDSWREFSLFGGPQLQAVVHNNRIALIGEASHALSDVFGAGAAFVFEDTYVLNSTLVFSRKRGVSLHTRSRGSILSVHRRMSYIILFLLPRLCSSPDTDPRPVQSA
ncbi:hypothetical protein BD413DRAFT_648036 [Trametes elegans]|nr:hypothetical protein BD413DRAFT_648036 [Trametes elegans]